ncbi:MAG: hypothetical protein WEE53_12910 [Acidimicrobiia bacterium]
MDVGDLLTRWRAAEAKLYPMVVVSPHQYEVNLTLVRAMTDDLSDITTVDDLISAYEHRVDRLAEAVDRLSVAAPSAEVGDLVADAAFQGRYRELPSERQQGDAVRRIAAAGAGPAWVLLGEFGDDAAGVATGFRRIEMRIPDGLGMHSYIDIDATTFLPLFGIEILQLDPDTGEFAGTHARPERREFTDREEWLAAIAATKAATDG